MVDNFSILNRIRWIALFCQLILLIVSIKYYQIKLPVLQISLILFLEFIVTILMTYFLNRGLKYSQNNLLINISFDAIMISGVIYFSGGASNPFTYLLLLYIALGSFMLNPKQLFALVVIELTLYSLLNIFQYPIELGDSSPLSSFHFHLAGMWINFVLTVVLLAFFGLITRSALVRQEKQLQKLREKNLQDEQILGLGIMSASAAHELGTPLSTMAIVIDDIHHSGISETQKQDMDILNEQIVRCRKIISNLNMKSEHASLQITQQKKSSQPNEISLEEQLKLIVNNWLVYQPKIILEENWNIKVKNQYEISISLEQAITNLLDNAGEASLENNRDNLNIHIYDKEDNGENKLFIDITDYGSGFTEDKHQLIGKQIQKTEKENGLGWGAFLSNVSIERVGGKVEIINNHHNSGIQGCLTRITIPVGS